MKIEYSNEIDSLDFDASFKLSFKGSINNPRKFTHYYYKLNFYLRLLKNHYVKNSL